MGGAECNTAITCLVCCSPSLVSVSWPSGRRVLHTIASYRDTFRLLLQFAQKRLRKAPSQLGLEDLDASLIGAFPDDLEKHRHNGARSRNLRLTAVRSFFRYAALESPPHAGVIQRVLAIPNQRQLRALVPFLTRPEIDALLAALDRQTWLGLRQSR